MSTPPPAARTRTPSGKTVKAGPGAHPPLRKTPKGLTYAQGRPHPPGQPQPAAGPGPAPAPAPAPAGTAARGRRLRPGQALAGLVTGLFGYGYLINWIRGGPAQATGWLKAKFFNEPYQPASGG